TELTPSSGYAPYLGAFVDATGGLWLGGPAGELYQARISGDSLETLRFTNSPTFNRLHWLTGQVAESSTNIYALSIEGTLEHYDGTGFTTKYSFIYDSTIAWKAGLAFVGPDELVSVFSSDSAIVRVKDGVVTQESAPTAGALHTVMFSPE